MFIIWEGVDKVGKDTLKALYDKKTKWADVNLNRGPLGYLAYDKAFNRETTESVRRHLEEWEQIKNNALVVYLEADTKDIMKRIAEHGDEFYEASELDRHKALHRQVIEEHGLAHRTMAFDTSQERPDAICDAIFKKAMQLRSQTFLSAVRASGRFSAFDEVFGVLCKFYEPVDVTFTPNQLDQIVEFDASYDQLYYDQLEAACLHRLQAYKSGFVGSRQVVTVQADCISFVLWDVPFEGDDSPLRLHVMQRSWNVGGHGMNDVAFCKHLIERAIELKLIDGRFWCDYVVHWHCVFPHEFMEGGD